MEIESNYKITKNNNVWYTLDFGEVVVGDENVAIIKVIGRKVTKTRSSCQCTVADIQDNKVEVKYKGNQVKKIHQRVVLTTDIGEEVYIDITGEVK